MTPNPAATVGLGVSTPIPTDTVWDRVQAANIDNKLSYVPQTPSHIPTLGHSSHWKEHVREPITNEGLDIMKDLAKKHEWNAAIASTSDLRVEDALMAIGDVFF